MANTRALIPVRVGMVNGIQRRRRRNVAVCPSGDIEVVRPSARADVEAEWILVERRLSGGDGIGERRRFEYRLNVVVRQFVQKVDGSRV